MLTDHEVPTYANGWDEGLTPECLGKSKLAIQQAHCTGWPSAFL